MNLKTKKKPQTFIILPSTLLLFSCHSYHFVMCLWFFTGAQKVQLSQGRSNGVTFISPVLIISFIPRTHLPPLAMRVGCVIPFSFTDTSSLSVTVLSPVWSLGAKFSAPNADCWFFFFLPAPRFITKPIKMEGLLTESVPHILVLWRWIILLISKEWQMCMKFNISVTDCRLVAWMLIPGFGSSSTTLCSLCW